MKRLQHLRRVFPALTLRNRQSYSWGLVSSSLHRKSPKVGIYVVALLASASTAFYAGSQLRPIAGTESKQMTVAKQKPLYASRAELETVRRDVKRTPS